MTRDLAADVVGRRALGRRVAAAEVRHRAVGAEQVRGEQDLAERVVRDLAAARGPAVLGAVAIEAASSDASSRPTPRPRRGGSSLGRYAFDVAGAAVRGDRVRPPRPRSARTLAHSGRTSVR